MTMITSNILHLVEKFSHNNNNNKNIHLITNSCIEKLGTGTIKKNISILHVR